MSELKAKWIAPHLTTRDLFFLTLAFVFQGLTRVWDYMTGEDFSLTYSLVENTMPFKYWAILLMVAVGFLMVGLLLKNHFAIWLGNSLNALIYLVLTVGVFFGLFVTPYPWDGFRVFGVFGVLLAFHLICALRMGPQPLRPESANE